MCGKREKQQQQQQQQQKSGKKRRDRAGEKAKHKGQDCVIFKRQNARNCYVQNK